jgi:hypothetical protein
MGGLSSAVFPPEGALVVHYARGEPFLSITAAGPARWPEIVAGLSDANCWGRARFSDPHYLSRRVEVEAQMRAELLARGGRPRLEHPSYGLLGRDPRWERPDQGGMRAYLVPLSCLPADAVSFTFGDSLVCRHPANLAIWQANGKFMHPWCGRLFLLQDLAEASRQLPPEQLPPEAGQRGFAGCLEVQLWAEPPPQAVQVVELP